MVVGHHYLAEGDPVRIVDGTAGVLTESDTSSDSNPSAEALADSAQTEDPAAEE